MFLYAYNFSLFSSMEFVGEEDQNLIAKGKRTKRQKLQMLISQNSNFSEPDSELVGHCHSFFNFSSPPSSDGRDGGGDDGDDEEMANCLILLAQGPPAFQPSSSLGKFMGAPEGQIAGAGKAVGSCVYECKICNRTFPSFQALGGHRSSHKNSAITGGGGGQNPISGTSPANEQQRKQINNNNISSPFDQLIRFSRSDCYNKKFKLVDNNNKIHECSICGAEFMSGQALGGHMRRHRRVCDGAFEDSGEIERHRLKKQRSNLLCLNLDLNLPAPEYDIGDQSGVVVMAGPAALVGCHF